MTASVPAPQHVVDEVAGRLCDPGRVARAATGFSRVADLRPLSLSGAHLGPALLLGVLERRSAAHAHLTRTVSAAPAPGGLYSGLAALAFTAHAVAGRSGDYSGLLEQLDAHVTVSIQRRVASFRAQLSAPHRAPVTFDRYDVPYGLTGLGRLLLARGPAHHDTVADVLGVLAGLTGTLEVSHRTVPGWWVAGPPTGDPDPEYEDGHGNLGVAHGITGPLCLLAVAWQEGVRVDGHAAAMERIATWLMERQVHDGYGPFWPATVTLSPAPAPVFRGSWCYGVPGIARALQLAGRALGEPRWESVAVEAMGAMRERPVDAWGVSGASLCHGWAGIVQVACRIFADSGDPAVEEVAHLAAARLLRLYDPAAPFRFRHPTHRHGELDVAGLIEGAAGVALALHTYAHRQTSPSWDAALLLS